ncbi:hypothetical protein [Terrisporobacter mayombei]|uniref:DUF3784 domain-containing protein n=1 Tax=Terrisporobacter mayombei TaxID=1541 RepID=A0ABY9Q0S4_9FIRM|nr:hypothetical protein [Terrisporobacter mayombei]MCC3868049.1 hypothetical protein [Terrisporobacter mayombei]WMT80187.1 hypothetical protein TEMA_05000 [Terrisporobacter mayombei]
MSEQIIILLFLILGTGSTIFLYVWKAKKEIDYKKDERWKLIQNKANITANYLNYILIVFLAIGDTILIFCDIHITLTLNRVFTYVLCFIGLRNAIELFSLRYFDNQL